LIEKGCPESDALFLITKNEQRLRLSLLWCFVPGPEKMALVQNTTRSFNLIANVGALSF